MFALHLRLALDGPEGRVPVPKSWLDLFFMRNFIGRSAFDETLAVADGRLEAGFSVRPDDVREELEKWLRGRRMIVPGTRVIVEQAAETAGRPVLA